MRRGGGGEKEVAGGLSGGNGWEGWIITEVLRSRKQEGDKKVGR